MQPDNYHDSTHSVDELAARARRMQEEARIAAKQGDYERAGALAEEAQLLAGDIAEMVDAMEQRQDDALLQEAVDYYAAASSSPRKQGRFSWLRNSRLGASIGAGLGLSLALVEC